jgi:hypothetical protein
MLVRQIADRLQLDKPLAYAMAARIWQSVSGPITIVFLVRSLSLSEQGIYYSLVSILGIQMFFELGLQNILVSYAGHQAPLAETEAGRGSTHALIRSATRWFGSASVLFAIAALGVGWRTMSGVETTLVWREPLIVMVLATAVVVAVSPAISILEGFGFRDDVYRMRLVQMITGSLAVWVTLNLGLKLWSIAVAACVQALCSLYLARIRYAHFFQRFRTAPHAPADFSWVKDVIPIQWRLALISAVYHLATQFFTVIVLNFHSQEEAGRLGMTLSLTGAIQAIALVWVQTKFALVSLHHGAGDREAAGTMWRRTAVISTSLLLLALSTALVLLWLMPLANLGLEKRFITPQQLVILAIGIVANHLISVEGYYVTSRRARPLLFAALTGFTSTLVAVWGGGYLWSTDGVLLGYTLTTALITLPLHTLAYIKFRQEVDPSASQSSPAQSI